jgi:hypothetical protein
MPVGAAPPGAFGGLAAVDPGFSREGSNPLSASCCLQGARGGGRLPRDPPFRQRNPECRRDLLQCYTVDLVHEQDFSLARSEHAAPPLGVEGGERLIEPFLCSARGLSPAAALSCSLMLMPLCLMRDQLNSPITRVWP